MTALDIYNLLENKIRPDAFQKKYNDEIKNYENLVKKTGSTVPIYVDEDYAFKFNGSHLITICNFYINNSLDEIVINYLADGITLSDTIELDSPLFDILATFTDPDINGKLSESYVLDTLTKLKNIK
ncbi:hypothetical protein ACX0HA_12625 [Flavobacterium hauense]